MQTEKEMRESKVPEIDSIEALNQYIATLVDREHDYGTCVYAMSMAATAAFNYVAGKLGVTGFQASCADLDIIRRTRMIDGPFALIKGQDMLYPQYDIQSKVAQMLDDWSEWASSAAEDKLKESNEYAHQDVVAHWKSLARNKV